MLTFITILASLTAVAAGVLAFIFLLPADKRAKLNGFGRFLHDFCNFKDFWLEKILKFMYIVATVYSVVYGALNFLFGFYTYENYVSGYFDTELGEWVEGYTETLLGWNGWNGLIVLILGPIAIRIAYELIILVIRALRGLIGINDKLGETLNVKMAEDTPIEEAPIEEAPIEEAPAVEEPVAPAPAATKAVFCTHCGQYLNAEGKCPNPICPGK